MTGQRLTNQVNDSAPSMPTNDVTEELVRLKATLSSFGNCLTNRAGRQKMDFLVQEMNREVNTTGSKCCDAEMAKLVKEAKAELEKIREQIQNIE